MSLSLPSRRVRLTCQYFEVIREAVEASIEFAQSQPQTRQIIEITAANLSARQAHRGGMVEVEDRLSEAFVKRTRHANKFNVEPRLMALTTIMVSDLTLTSWFLGEIERLRNSGKECVRKANPFILPKQRRICSNPRQSSQTEAACAPISRCLECT